MGNNNVTAQQVSEEPAHSADKITEPSTGSPRLDSSNSEKSMADNEKDGTQDTNTSNSLKDSNAPNSRDEQVVSGQDDSIEGLDEKNRGSIQNSTSTQDKSGDLPNEDQELVKDEATETIIYPTGTITVSKTIEDMISTNGSSMSSDTVKQLMHGTQDSSQESKVGNSSSVEEENTEGSLEGEAESINHENTPMSDNLSSEDTNEISQQGHIKVSEVEDQLMAMQRETASSTESILTTYLDADDSEIKEVVIEDKPRQQQSPCLQQLDVTNMETSRSYTTEIPQEKEEISAISKTTTVELMIAKDEVTEEDKNIHGYEDTPQYIAHDNIYTGEDVAQFQPNLRNPSAIYEQELEKHEQNERGVASKNISGSVSATVKHSGIEKSYMKEEGIVDNNVAVQNLAEKFNWEKEPEAYDSDLVSPVESNGKSLTCLHPSSSHHLLTVNEEKEQREVNRILDHDKEIVKEILEQGNKISKAKGSGQCIDAQVAAMEGEYLFNLPMSTPSTPLLLLEDFDKGCIKTDSSDSKEGTITTTYDARTRDTQDKEGTITTAYDARTRDTQDTTTITSSQGDLSQLILLEEHDVVKLENGDILSTCVELMDDCSNKGKLFTYGPNHENVGGNATSIISTIESNLVGVTAITTDVGFMAECNQATVTASADRATEEHYPLRTSRPGREGGEDTSLLQRVERIGSYSHSTEHHSNVSVGMSMNDISVMQLKAEAEAEEESEKSPLLSPREPSEDLRVPNHSAITRKPFQSFMAEDRVGILSPLNEQELIQDNVSVSSPRSKGKQKAKSSLLTSCMCCASYTN
ncbi:hypothetical protein ACP4OV_024737 [Aristida adscensionis]